MIHCKHEWLIEERKKPKKQRKPLPSEPPMFKFMKMRDGRLDLNQLQAYNDEAFRYFYTNSIVVPCMGCKQTFSEKELRKHM